VVIPVFSNIAVEPRPPNQASSAPLLLGVVGYANDGVNPPLLVEALSRLPSRPGLRVLLLGAPGPDSPWGERWRRAAQDAGIGELLEFTGVLPPQELSRQLSACDLVVFPDEAGPSSRKGTLAAALAHGRPVVAIDGPEGWPLLIEAGAVHLCTADPAQLATAIDRLHRDVAVRNGLGAAATAFYSQHMRLELAGAKVVALMRNATPDCSTGHVHGTTAGR
jgi:glycosyltransferase involved in cell wall biosynthesis